MVITNSPEQCSKPKLTLFQRRPKISSPPLHGLIGFRNILFCPPGSSAEEFLCCCSHSLRIFSAPCQHFLAPLMAQRPPRGARMGCVNWLYQLPSETKSIFGVNGHFYIRVLLEPIIRKCQNLALESATIITDQMKKTHYLNVLTIHSSLILQLHLMLEE